MGHTQHTQSEADAGGGRYRLVERLGDGYGGVVFSAVDRTSGATVALKRLHRWSCAHDAAREFAILSRLRHPCLVRVLDFHRDDEGLPFYTMELLPGAGRLRTGPLPGMEAFLRSARDLLSGLAYLHAQGVVHADLKPSNIYFPADAHSPLRLLDFGLALDHGDTDGTPRGTLMYLAPEVLHGEVPTPSSDLYSLGVVLHELLTGSHRVHRRDPARQADPRPRVGARGTPRRAL